MIVSLEAIFLSTFVLISQNRGRRETPGPGRPSSGGRSRKEERQDQQLLRLSNQILELTKAIHAMTATRSPTDPNGTEPAARSSIRNAMGE
jgi:hypothetical protein